MPGLFCSAAFGLVRIAYCGRLGRGRRKNRAIKRFRNRASSNRDFISISINRTALILSQSTAVFPQSVENVVNTRSSMGKKNTVIYRGNRYNLEKYRDIHFWSYHPALLSKFNVHYAKYRKEILNIELGVGVYMNVFLRGTVLRKV